MPSASQTDDVALMKPALPRWSATDSLLLAGILGLALITVLHDSFPTFFASLLHYPQSLKPANLLARLSRFKPTLEAE